MLSARQPGDLPEPSRVMLSCSCCYPLFDASYLAGLADDEKP